MSTSAHKTPFILYFQVKLHIYCSLYVFLDHFSYVELCFLFFFFLFLAKQDLNSLTRDQRGFPGFSEVNNPPAMQKGQEMQVRSVGWEDPLEEGMATHSSILAYRIPWTEEPGGLPVHGVTKSQTQLSD